MPIAHRDCADAECEDVGEGGDGDGDAGVLHRQTDPLRHRRDRLLLLRGNDYMTSALRGDPPKGR